MTINCTHTQQYMTVFDCNLILSFGLPKSLTKELTKNRISAHDFFNWTWPLLQTKNSTWATNLCAMQSGGRWGAFFLLCRKYTNLRITLFNKLNLKIPVLKPNTNECFKLLYELMNPSNVVDTKLIYSWGVRIEVVDLLIVFSCLFCLMFIFYISCQWRTPSVFVGFPIKYSILFCSWTNTLYQARLFRLGSAARPWLSYPTLLRLG